MSCSSGVAAVRSRLSFCGVQAAKLAAAIKEPRGILSFMAPRDPAPRESKLAARGPPMCSFCPGNLGLVYFGAAAGLFSPRKNAPNRQHSLDPLDRRSASEEQRGDHSALRFDRRK